MNPGPVAPGPVWLQINDVGVEGAVRSVYSGAGSVGT